jgi:hypothetical protein
MKVEAAGAFLNEAVGVFLGSREVSVKAIGEI